MKTLLYDKPSVQSFLTLLSAKFRNLFLTITGYDIMFEASREDVKAVAATNSQRPKQASSNTIYSWPLFAQNQFRSAH